MRDAAAVIPSPYAALLGYEHVLLPKFTFCTITSLITTNYPIQIKESILKCRKMIKAERKCHKKVKLIHFYSVYINSLTRKT